MIGAPSLAGSQSAVALHGSWRATAGARTLQGTWTATVDPKTPNLAHGEWTLLGGNRTTLHGPGGAEKRGGGGGGTGAARVARGGGAAPPLTGTWQATVKGPAVKTLADMLHA